MCIVQSNAYILKIWIQFFNFSTKLKHMHMCTNHVSHFNNSIGLVSIVVHVSNCKFITKWMKCWVIIWQFDTSNLSYKCMFDLEVPTFLGIKWPYIPPTFSLKHNTKWLSLCWITPLEQGGPKVRTP
jgi:hypothetical protein